MERNTHRPRRFAPLLLATVAAPLALVTLVAGGQPTTSETAQAPAASEPHRVVIVLARERRDAPPPLSPLDAPPPDEGVAGARLAINDNNTTGRFLNQEFTLEVVESRNAEELVAQVEARVEARRFLRRGRCRPADAACAGRPAQGPGRADPQCRLARRRTARAGLPGKRGAHAALARHARGCAGAVSRLEALAALVPGDGTEPDDAAFAEALRRAAKRFGAKIVEERPFKYEAGSRRADGGHEQLQEQIPAFTRNAPAHDVLVVADESGLFGDYLPYRTAEARPVAGTQGLVPTSWHPALEQWGATQLQNRFRRLADRPMRPLDYDAWVAVRSVGEAATRAKNAPIAPADLIAHLKSTEFELAAFKGRKLSYRAWDGQLRQPILLATAKLPVTVSPQPGFLHQFTELDTLGIDKPETNAGPTRLETCCAANGGTPCVHRAERHFAAA